MYIQCFYNSISHNIYINPVLSERTMYFAWVKPYSTQVEDTRLLAQSGSTMITKIIKLLIAAINVSRTLLGGLGTCSDHVYLSNDFQMTNLNTLLRTEAGRNLYASVGRSHLSSSSMHRSNHVGLFAVSGSQSDKGVNYVTSNHPRKQPTLPTEHSLSPSQ